MSASQAPAGPAQVPAVPPHQPAGAPRASVRDVIFMLVAVAVTSRGQVTGAPWRFRVGRRWHPVGSWAGPWPVDESWWLGPGAGGRAARFQVVGVDGRAWLLRWQAPGAWQVEAAYD